jgi:hypothetical protein
LGFHGGLGDAWTFVALDPDSKLIPSYHVGQRTALHAEFFLKDLVSRLSNRVQLSSDGLTAYREAVAKSFGHDVDYGQVVKTYSFVNLNQSAAGRYSPAEVVKIQKTVVQGEPDKAAICTSHVEKQNTLFGCTAAG